MTTRHRGRKPEAADPAAGGDGGGDGGAEAATTAQRRRRRVQVRPGDDHDAGLELRDRDGVVLHRAPAEIAESIRYTLARVGLKRPDGLPRTVGVISAVSGEGVTFVARTLALVLASDYDERVCLLDLNWAHPSIPDNDSPGIADVIARGVALDTAILHTALPELDLLPAGPATPAARPMLSKSPRLADVFSELGTRYDHIVVDLPAALTSSEGLILAGLCDTLVFVVRHGGAPEGQIAEAIAELGAPSILGVVLNAMETRTPRRLLRRIPRW